MKRSPMPPRRSELRRVPFRVQPRAPRMGSPAARSRARAEAEMAATVLGQLVARDRYCVFGRCTSPIADGHHRLPRGAGGAMHDDTRWALSRLIGLCRAHHNWVETHRTEAYALGYLVRHGLISPSEVPVLWHGVWRLLDDHGCLIPCDPPEGMD